MMTMKKMTKKDEFPKEPHYAIIEFGQRHQDSGYDNDSGYMVNTTEYYYTFDKAEWEAEISRLTVKTEYGKPSFVALKANPVTIVTSIKVNIKE
jgi:hypothetical protein